MTDDAADFVELIYSDAHGHNRTHFILKKSAIGGFALIESTDKTIGGTCIYDQYLSSIASVHDIKPDELFALIFGHVPRKRIDLTDGEPT